jgi:hypothetical protein
MCRSKAKTLALDDADHLQDPNATDLLNTIPNCYTAGDICQEDEDGYMWPMGRADDVISGWQLTRHREVESRWSATTPWRGCRSAKTQACRRVHQGLCHFETVK